MSQFIIEDIAIEDTVRDSKTILVLEKTGEKKEIDEITAVKYKVLDIIFNRSKAKEIKKEVFVLPANTGLIKALSKHQAEQGNQGMPSPIVKGYKTSLTAEKFSKAKKFIAFLITKDEKGEVFEYIYENSYDSIEKLGAIKKLVIEFNKDKY